VFQQLLDEVPPDNFTLDWLMGRLGKRSFGIIMLLLAVVGLAPGVSIIAGLLLFIPAFQMILGHAAPLFPRSIAARPLPTPQLTAVVRRAVPALQKLENFVYPRWPIPHQAAKRLVGLVVLLLDITLTFTPLPFSNIPPALVIGLISLAYLQEDGLVLSAALVLAIALLAVDGLAVWETVRDAEWLYSHR
jgi:hypothetical protein